MSERTPHVEPTLSSSGSLAPAYFDQLYARNSDPWEFATSSYEADKYAATLGALPSGIYPRVLELGCSIGVFTQQLASRCRELLATDISEAALVKARERCANLPHVSFVCLDMIATFPSGPFDLIVSSEVGYYLSKSDLKVLRDKITAALETGGYLLLVHYTGETNYPLSADEVHDLFLDGSGPLRKVKGYRADRYRLDLLIKQ